MQHDEDGYSHYEMDQNEDQSGLKGHKEAETTKIGQQQIWLLKSQSKTKLNSRYCVYSGHVF